MIDSDNPTLESTETPSAVEMEMATEMATAAVVVAETHEDEEKMLAESHVLMVSAAAK